MKAKVLVPGLSTNETDLCVQLMGICEDLNAECDDHCPVYKANGSRIVNDGIGNCKVCLSGHKMVAFLKGVKS